MCAPPPQPPADDHPLGVLGSASTCTHVTTCVTHVCGGGGYGGGTHTQ